MLWLVLLYILAWFLALWVSPRVTTRRFSSWEHLNAFLQEQVLLFDARHWPGYEWIGYNYLCDFVHVIQVRGVRNLLPEEKTSYVDKAAHELTDEERLRNFASRLARTTDWRTVNRAHFLCAPLEYSMAIDPAVRGEAGEFPQWHTYATMQRALTKTPTLHAKATYTAERHRLMFDDRAGCEFRFRYRHRLRWDAQTLLLPVRALVDILCR